MVEWLSSWLAEQEVRGSIPGLTTWISEIGYILLPSRDMAEIPLFKPKSDIQCNRSATSPRPKFKTIAEVAEESQLGFAVGRRLVGDWSATNRRLVADWSATGRRPRGDLFATWCNWSPTGRGPVPD